MMIQSSDDNALPPRSPTKSPSKEHDLKRRRTTAHDTSVIIGYDKENASVVNTPLSKTARTLDCRPEKTILSTAPILPDPVHAAKSAAIQSDHDYFDDDLDDDLLHALDDVACDPPHDFNDEFDDGLLNAMMAGFEAPSSGQKKYWRYVVAQIEEHPSLNQKTITLIDPKSPDAQTILCFLRECWQYCVVHVNDIVHLVNAQRTSEGAWLLNDSQGYFVVKPDTLISGTVVSDSISCIRRPVLNSRIKSATDRNANLLYGSMLHQLFQTALLSDRPLQDLIPEVVGAHLEDLWCLGESDAMAMSHLREMVPRFNDWISTYMGSAPQQKATISEHRGQGKDSTIAISKVLDIEENVWSPMYGLKGKVDATTLVKHRNQGNQLQTSLVPFELKTGKSILNMSHRAQTSLYTLLLSDRYDIQVGFGLLYYSKTGDIIRIQASHDELRHLILNRNELASYLSSSTALPPVIRNNHICQRCFSLDACLLYHKTKENGTAQTSGLGSIFDGKTGHLSAQDVDCFNKWESLVSLEERTLVQFRNEIWTMSSEEREKSGRCIGSLKLIERLSSEEGGSAIVAYRYKLGRPEGLSTSTTQLLPGDAIVVSTERGHLALAIGFVDDVAPDHIIVCIDHALTGGPNRESDFDASLNQNFSGLVEYESVFDNRGRTLKREFQNADLHDRVLYRIDKDEMMGGMGTSRFNLLHLFLANGDTKRRQLIVDLAKPRFHEDWKQEVAGGDLKKCHAVEDILTAAHLNENQRKSLEMSITAKDYALIWGIPGSGKTTTIVSIIKAFAALGKSILVTSYTHTAVDNILLKLKEASLDFLRIGNRDKVHPDIRNHVLGKTSYDSVAKLEELVNSKSIVAATCLATNHSLFAKKKFDVCIVDEASQITLPICIGPLRYADTFVLVGDHYQLPAVVQNKEARDGGLSDSLFKLLSDAHPDAVCLLKEQYRMNNDIMLLSNSLIYNGQLLSHPSSANRKLQVRHPHFETLPAWLHAVLDPERPVIFFNTDHLPASELRKGDLVQNVAESALVAQAVECLVEAGLAETEIGIISPYRSQLNLIQKKLNHLPRIEVHTVDKFQGRDKECIIMSFVRSNTSQVVGDLLRDQRRLNVAWTRAKSKLVLIGSKSTLEASPICAEMLKLVDTKAWFFEMNENNNTTVSTGKTHGQVKTEK